MIVVLPPEWVFDVSEIYILLNVSDFIYDIIHFIFVNGVLLANNVSKMCCSLETYPFVVLAYCFVFIVFVLTLLITLIFVLPFFV